MATFIMDTLGNKRQNLIEIIMKFYVIRESGTEYQDRPNISSSIESNGWSKTVCCGFKIS
jgi:hypothetical protein